MVIRNKKGQVMGIPFQMIFSLILIAIFIYAAFTGISYFLERGEQVKLVRFVTEFEAKVNTIWQATDAEQRFTFDLPKRIDEVCFGDLSKPSPYNICPDFEIYRAQAALRGANMFFCPPIEATKIGADAYYKIDCNGYDCLGIEGFGGGYYCVQNKDGQVAITLKKDLGSPTVIIFD